MSRDNDSSSGGLEAELTGGSPLLALDSPPIVRACGLYVEPKGMFSRRTFGRILMDPRYQIGSVLR